MASERERLLLKNKYFCFRILENLLNLFPIIVSISSALAYYRSLFAVGWFRFGEYDALPYE